MAGKKSKSVFIMAKPGMVKFKDLRPNPDNPRDNEEAIPKVKKSIQNYGYNVYITVNKDNLILAGHTRYEALKELMEEGFKIDLGEGPVDFTPETEIRVNMADHLSNTKGEAFSLVDNKSAEFSGWNWEKLEVKLVDLGPIEDLSEWFPPLETEEFEEAPSEDDGDTETFETGEDTSEKKKTIICPHCGEVIEL